MKKLLIIASIALAITGCTPSAKDISEQYTLPEELSDCTITHLQGKYTYLNVVRCPNSTTSTTYPVGKTTQTTVVIDGETYVKQ
jgi:hypothetical protein